MYCNVCLPCSDAIPCDSTGNCRHSGIPMPNTPDAAFAWKSSVTCLWSLRALMSILKGRNNFQNLLQSPKINTHVLASKLPVRAWVNFFKILPWFPDLKLIRILVLLTKHYKINVYRQFFCSLAMHPSETHYTESFGISLFSKWGPHK